MISKHPEKVSETPSQRSLLLGSLWLTIPRFTPFTSHQNQGAGPALCQSGILVLVLLPGHSLHQAGTQPMDIVLQSQEPLGAGVQRSILRALKRLSHLTHTQRQTRTDRRNQTHTHTQTDVLRRAPT